MITREMTMNLRKLDYDYEHEHEHDGGPALRSSESVGGFMERGRAWEASTVSPLIARSALLAARRESSLACGVVHCRYYSPRMKLDALEDRLTPWRPARLGASRPGVASLRDLLDSRRVMAD